MIFRYYPLLFLIPPILFLLFRSARARTSGSYLKFPVRNRSLVLNATSQTSFLVPLFLRSLGITLLILALARPQTSSSQVRRLSEGIDIMVALDVSQSMMIEDVSTSDVNRLDVAKETVRNFIKGRKDDRIGFLMFAGEALTLCPPTLDYDFLLQSVDLAGFNQLKDGTAIGDAIATSVNRIKDSSSKSRVIILITDGDNNMGAIAPLTAGDIAAGYGIRVYTIALGKDGMVNVPVYSNMFGVMTKSYQQINSTINPELLVKIAKETNGKFFRAGDDSSLQRVFDEINRLERSKVETKDRILWNEHFQIFLLLGFLILILDLALRSTIFRVLPE